MEEVRDATATEADRDDPGDVGGPHRRRLGDRPRGGRDSDGQGIVIGGDIELGFVELDGGGERSGHGQVPERIAA
jgi:hypothetical protein